MENLAEYFIYEISSTGPQLHHIPLFWEHFFVAGINFSFPVSFAPSPK
jgi:hypothetical protein